MPRQICICLAHQLFFPVRRNRCNSSPYDEILKSFRIRNVLILYHIFYVMTLCVISYRLGLAALQAQLRKGVSIYVLYNTKTWKKTPFLHEQGLSQNYFTQNSCVNYNKGEFATKQRKIYWPITISKIGPPHN